MDTTSVVINSTIQEQVYQILKHEVINRVFQGGEQLKEAELAKRFNVSRSPCARRCTVLRATVYSL